MWKPVSWAIVRARPLVFFSITGALRAVLTHQLLRAALLSPLGARSKLRVAKRPLQYT